MEKTPSGEDTWRGRGIVEARGLSEARRKSKEDDGEDKRKLKACGTRIQETLEDLLNSRTGHARTGPDACLPH